MSDYELLEKDCRVVVLINMSDTPACISTSCVLSWLEALHSAQTHHCSASLWRLLSYYYSEAFERTVTTAQPSFMMLILIYVFVFW